MCLCRARLPDCRIGGPRALQTHCRGRHFPPCRSALFWLCFPPSDKVCVPPSDRVVSRMGRPRGSGPQEGLAKERKGADFGLLPSLHSELLFFSPSPRVPRFFLIPPGSHQPGLARESPFIRTPKGTANTSPTRQEREDGFISHSRAEFESRSRRRSCHSWWDMQFSSKGTDLDLCSMHTVA